ncbi:hypothetical protein [Alicyclobacillus ferrooxydans]|uniref:hypothetical protein n=1 Tax=Alicyclobacillus ferrooxydans TaxID=471514 RepID=UPI0006D52DF9|nr:hypothetical protein [Alicyclobacillus ferrooxydans]
MYAKTIMVMLAGLVVLTLTACGQGEGNTSSSNKTVYRTPQVQLPSGVTSHLTGYHQRVVTRPQLPLRHALDAGGTSLSIHASNVLYIAPSEAYAITQYKQVWNRLTSVPAVVWTSTTPTIAHKEWLHEGYKTDPLPSHQTYYTYSNIPTPDSYHRQTKGWTELPGVLKTSQIKQWMTFFSATK